MNTLISNITKDSNTQNLLHAYGLKAHSITWEDTGRTKGSCWGPNISDMTLVVKDDKTLMPVIRKPNFSDLTEDIPIETFTVKVGNEGKSNTRIISLKEYIANLSLYTDNTHKTNLLCERDTMILTSAQCCVLPVDKGTTEFCVQLFNYQSYNDSPAVLIILVSKDGVSTQVIETRNQKLFFNDKGNARWFKVERLQDVRTRETGQPQEKISSYTEMKGEEKRQNILMIFQIPLKVKREETIFFGSSCMTQGATRCVTRNATRGGRGMDFGMLSQGTIAEKYIGTKNLELERDDRFPIRCTFQYYRVTDQNNISENDIKDISTQLNQSGKVAVASGSLVCSTTERKTEPILNDNKHSDNPFGKLDKRDYIQPNSSSIDPTMASFL